MFASLRSRLIIILVAAVLPAAILVCIFAYNSFRDIREQQIDSLGRDTDLLLSRIDVVPQSALRLAATLASFGTYPDEPRGACEAKAAEMIERYPAFAGFAVVGPDGPRCSAVRQSAPPIAEVIAALPAGRKTLVGPHSALARLADGRVLLVAEAPAPGPEAGGRRVVIALDDRYIASILGAFRSTPSSVAALVDETGALMMSPAGQLTADHWPAAAPPLTDQRSIEASRAESGRALITTTARLGALDLWLVTAQAESDVVGGPLRQLLLTVAAPLLMILVGAIAMWLGLRSSVLRWVSTLNRATRAHAAGALTSRVGDTSEAPREFAELAASFDTLADRMADRTLDLEREVAAKTSYIREIHHRVKNNLQVIGSLLALQKRELSAEQRAVLRFPEDRVNAMSAAYRASYAVSEIGRVPIGNVVREVGHRLQTSGDGRQIRLDFDFTGAELEIDLDTAVSIAMLLAEILPAFADSADRNGDAVKLTLAASPDRLRLLVEGRMGVERAGMALSRRFVQAYLRQLDAAMEETETATAIEAPFPKPQRAA